MWYNIGVVRNKEKTSMKTYIVDWYNKTRNGAWRNYRKAVSTDNIESYVRDKMKLVVGYRAFGQYKGTFGSATEVRESQSFGYQYEGIKGGEYWFTKDNKIVRGVATWMNKYDYKLKAWKTHDCI